jgi:hypothetical protein
MNPPETSHCFCRTKEKMRTIGAGITVAVLLCLLSLAACQTLPPPRPVVVAPPGVELPLTTTVLLEIAPGQRDFNVSAFGPYVWSYRESPLVKAAALDMMREIFSDVVLTEGPSENGIVFQISGYTSINPAVSTYYATAVADVFVRTEVGERQIGQYRGTGNAWGRIYSYPPLQAAYAAAFGELSRHLLADPILMSRLKSEAARRPAGASASFERLPRATIDNSSLHGPPRGCEGLEFVRVASNP